MYVWGFGLQGLGLRLRASGSELDFCKRLRCQCAAGRQAQWSFLQFLPVSSELSSSSSTANEGWGNNRVR